MSFIFSISLRLIGPSLFSVIKNDEFEDLYIISSNFPLYLFITKHEYILTSITMKSVNTIINFVFFLVIYKNAFFSIIFLLLEYIILYIYEIYMK